MQSQACLYTRTGQLLHSIHGRMMSTTLMISPTPVISKAAINCPAVHQNGINAAIPGTVTIQSHRRASSLELQILLASTFECHTTPDYEFECVHKDSIAARKTYLELQILQVLPDCISECYAK